MKFILATHKAIQRVTHLDNPKQTDIKDCLAAVSKLSQQPNVSFTVVLQAILSLLPEDRGHTPTLLLELLLIQWAANEAAFVTRYSRRLAMLTLVYYHKKHHKLPSTQALCSVRQCARFIALQSYQQQNIQAVFIKLRHYKQLRQAMELMARVLLQQEQEQALRIHAPKPLSHTFLTLITSWHQADNLDEVLKVIKQYPELEQRMKESATELTLQNKALSLKQALLLLGPEKSHEHLLVTHFETQLTRGYFPLKEDFRLRIHWLAILFQQLCEGQEVELPCHPKLLAYLWSFDVWFHDTLTVQTKWKYATHQALPDAVSLWQPLPETFSPRVALVLISQWQLPLGVKEALIPEQSNLADTNLHVCARLALISIPLLLEYSFDEWPASWEQELFLLLRKLSLTVSDYQSFLFQFASQQHLYCPVHHESYLTPLI